LLLSGKQSPRSDDLPPEVDVGESGAYHRRRGRRRVQVTTSSLGATSDDVAFRLVGAAVRAC